MFAKNSTGLPFGPKRLLMKVDQMAIGRHFKTVLGLAENEKIGYMVHDDAIRLERRAKDRYTV